MPSLCSAVSVKLRGSWYQQILQLQSSILTWSVYSMAVSRHHLFPVKRKEYTIQKPRDSHWTIGKSHRIPPADHVGHIKLGDLVVMRFPRENIRGMPWDAKLRRTIGMLGYTIR
jgi:hypothetical protein